MRPLVGIGGFMIAAERLGSLERALDRACEGAGFPEKDPTQPVHHEFKWSPTRSHWMRDGLVGGARTSFFRQVVWALAEHEVETLVVARETTCRPMNPNTEPDVDVIMTFVERVEMRLQAHSSDGVVIVDQSAEGGAAEGRYLFQRLSMLAEGTAFIMPTRLAINFISTPSHLIRCLQAADLVASASVARIAGSPWMREVFDDVKELLPRRDGLAGGVGLKLHPSLRLRNLYHWLTGDARYVESSGETIALPSADHPYSSDEGLSEA